LKAALCRERQEFFVVSCSTVGFRDDFAAALKVGSDDRMPTFRVEVNRGFRGGNASAAIHTISVEPTALSLAAWDSRRVVSNGKFGSVQFFEQLLDGLVTSCSKPIGGYVFG
jgi:hypothetical protein